ncbi:swr1 complex component [Blastocladiella emersonii ATCC 22665]|nr:swr1 complex component [Blastocladiella emersonii ATCC 22665]
MSVLDIPDELHALLPPRTRGRRPRSFFVTLTNLLLEHGYITQDALDRGEVSTAEITASLDAPWTFAAESVPVAPVPAVPALDAPAPAAPVPAAPAPAAPVPAAPVPAAPVPAASAPVYVAPDPATAGDRIARYLHTFVSYEDDDFLSPSAEHEADRRYAELLVALDQHREYTGRDLRTQGTDARKLLHASAKAAVPPTDPPAGQDHWWFVLNEMKRVRGLVLETAKAGPAAARRIARAVDKYWADARSADSRRAEQEVRDAKRGARDVARLVRNRWRLFDVLVTVKERQLAAAEQMRAGNESLDAILERSSATLERQQRALLGAEDSEDDEEDGDEEEGEGADGSDASEVERDEDLAAVGARARRRRRSAASAVDSAVSTPLGSPSFLSHRGDYSSDDGEPMDLDDQFDSPLAALITSNLSSPSAPIDDDEQQLPENAFAIDSDDAYDIEDTIDAEEALEHAADEDDEEMRGLQADLDMDPRELLRVHYGIDGDAIPTPDDSASDDNDEDEAEAGEVPTPNDVQQAGSLASSAPPPPPPTSSVPRADIQPSLLTGTLREYQQAGVNWLVTLYESKTNGVLADEMGLGKTIQTIALLAHLADVGDWGPHLVVVPTSVMLNWEMEFKKFCPGLKILTYYGSAKERKDKRAGWTRPGAFHVCITSYQLAVADASVFKRKHWGYMVLDEGHMVKNFRSQRWQTLLHFRTRHRLLLTGTPLQNNLNELWSLLYFLQPGGENSLEQQQWQAWLRPIDEFISRSGGVGGADAATASTSPEIMETIGKLHTLLRPYLLRRLKADVEKQLPAKYEHVLYCALSKRQRFLYDDYMSRATTRDTMASGNLLSIIHCLMQLRKVCNHPDLFAPRPIMSPLVVARGATYETAWHAVVNGTWTVPARTVPSMFLFDHDARAVAAAQELDPHAALLVVRDEAASAAAAAFRARSVSDAAGYRTLRAAADRLRERQLVRVAANWDRTATVNRARIHGRHALYPALDALTSSPAFRVGSVFPLVRVAAPAVLADSVGKFAMCTQQVRVVEAWPAGWHPLAGVYPGDLAPAAAAERVGGDDGALCALLDRARVAQSLHFPDKYLVQYDAGKLQTLARLLPQLHREGHRVLIFTQMTRMLDVLEHFLNLHGFKYFRLDGSTKPAQRQLLTDRFNRDARIFAFISSTRAGGVGINLTGADTVVFYDGDWNPSATAQAEARVHRIGQSRECHVYHLVTRHTVEENILRKSNQKRHLDRLVIQDGEFTTDHLLAGAAGTEGGGGGGEAAIDWRSMLEVAAERGQVDSILAAAEDAEDVAALRAQQSELRAAGQIDGDLFRDTAAGSASASAAAASGAQAGTEAMEVDGGSGGGSEATERPSIMSIDDFMFRHRCHETLGEFDPAWLLE